MLPLIQNRRLPRSRHDWIRLILIAIYIFGAYAIVTTMYQSYTRSRTINLLEKNMYAKMGSPDPYNRTWLDTMVLESRNMTAKQFKKRTDQTYAEIKQAVLHQLHDMAQVSFDHPEMIEALDEFEEEQALKLGSLKLAVTDKQAEKTTEEKKLNNRS